MDRLARVAALGSLVGLAAACGAAAPAAGSGAPLARGATPATPASGLRIARALSSGNLGYALAYARSSDRLVAVELTTAFELVVRDRRHRVISRAPLGRAEYDVGDLALAGDAATAWIASLDGRVRAIELASGAPTTEWKLGAPATAVAVSADGAHVATGDATGVLCLRRAGDGALLQCVAAHDGPVGGLAFGDGTLASAAHSGEVTVWEVPSLRMLHRRTRAGSANAVAWSPSGDRLAVAWSLAPPVRTPAVVDRERRRGFGAPDPHATIEVLPAAGGDPIAEMRGHAAAVTAVAWTPDGARVVSSSWDRTVRLWDARTGGQLARLTGFAYLVRDVAVSPDGRYVAAAAWAPALDARGVTLIELLYPRVTGR